MGMYTEIFVNVDLKDDVPDAIIATLRAMCARDLDSPLLKGKPGRWGVLFSNGSYYTPLTRAGELSWNEIAGHWSLIGKGDIKNENDEIEQFFAWIMPWIEAPEGEFIGYKRHEESNNPTLFFKHGVAETEAHG